MTMINEKKSLTYIIRTVFLGSIILIASCTEENEVESDFENATSESAFGIRDDKELSEYETVATNASPYNTSDFPDFSTVVHFSYSLDGSDNHEFVASGVLITSDWILTAGHNFFSSDEQTTPASVAGIVIHVGSDPNDPDQTRSVERLVFHPTWLDDDGLFTTANDLCLVRLTSSLSSIPTAELFDRVDETIGATIWYCGYGDYSGQPSQNPDDLSKRHAIQNILDRKVTGITSQTSQEEIFTGGLVAFDFDSPAGNINSLGDDRISEDETLLGTGTSDADATEFEGGTVEGDSGGPLFIQDGNEWKVIGILSGGATEPVLNHQDGDYGDISIFTRVSTSIDWINSVIEN